MKNTREFLNLLNGSTVKQLRQQARRLCPTAATMDKPALVAALVADRDAYRMEFVGPYLQVRKDRVARQTAEAAMQPSMF